MIDKCIFYPYALFHNICLGGGIRKTLCVSSEAVCSIWHDIKQVNVCFDADNALSACNISTD